MEKKVLELPLKAKWYDMIESGEKTEEYREIKPYWEKRLMDFVVEKVKEDGIFKSIAKWKFKHFDEVRFRYGYTKRTMTFECKGISKGLGVGKWGAPYDEVFIIDLGKRIN